MLDRCIARIVRAAALLVLPVSLLLFLQWPLRETVHAGSREANDLAQILFALYVSIALTAATREGSHLAVDVVARRYSNAVRKELSRAASLAIAIPASAYVLWTSASSAWLSVVQLEHFPETLNPGYFLVRVAAFGLALLVFLQAVLDVAGIRADRR